MATEVRQEQAAAASPVRIRRITDWRPGEGPREAEEGASPDDGVRWIDLDVLEPLAGRAPESTVRSLLETLGPHCGEQLDAAMIDDLLDVQDKREGERYSEGRVRSVSAFRVSTRRLTGEVEGERVGVGGELMLQPVEFLAGDGWVITAWHTRRTYRGAEPLREDDPPEDRDEVMEEARDRWLAEGAHSAGDLALLVLHELVLTYRAACFAIRGWLEEWELRLYLENDIDREGLQSLWGQMTRLREWIQPLNRPGLTRDARKAWFSGVTDHTFVARVDDEGVDRALAELGTLADMLRASFQVLSYRLLEDQRDRREQLQRRIEIAAAAFLVPTLIVGFYGANTHVPGEGTWWGFWTMVLALIVLSALSVAGVWLWQEREKRNREEGEAGLR